MDHQTPRQQDHSIQSPPRCGARIGGGRGEGSAGEAVDAFAAIASAPVDAAAAAAADPAMAATASAAANVAAFASASTASALLTDASAVGIAATTPPIAAAAAAPNVAANSAGNRDRSRDLYCSAVFALLEMSRSKGAHGVPHMEHTYNATEIGGDGSNVETTRRDEEGHEEQHKGTGDDVAKKYLAACEDGQHCCHNHHRRPSRSRSMSPSRGEKMDERQRSAVNSRGASSLVPRASGNVVWASAARASAADAGMNVRLAPAVGKAPIFTAGASAADDDRDPSKCASPQDDGDRGIAPSAAGARQRLAGVPQQVIRNDLGLFFDKASCSDFEHARSGGVIPAEVPTASGTALAFHQSADANTMKAGALRGKLAQYPSDDTTMTTNDAATITPAPTGNATATATATAMATATKTIKIVVRRRLGNATSLTRLYVPMDMASTFMPPLPSLGVCGEEKKKVRNSQRGGDGRAGGRITGKGAGGSGSKAAAGSSLSTMTVSFAVTAGPLPVGTGSGAPVVDSGSSGPVFSSAPVFGNDSSGPGVDNDSSGPVANNSSRFPADNDADLEQPTERGDEKLATSTKLYYVEYERRHFGDQVHHRLTKGWQAVCLALKARVGDTLEMTMNRSRGDQDIKGNHRRLGYKDGGVDLGDDDDAGPAAGGSSTIFVRVLN